MSRVSLPFNVLMGIIFERRLHVPYEPVQAPQLADVSEVRAGSLAAGVRPAAEERYVNSSYYNVNDIGVAVASAP